MATSDSEPDPPRDPPGAASGDLGSCDPSGDLPCDAPPDLPCDLTRDPPPDPGRQRNSRSAVLGESDESLEGDGVRHSRRTRRSESDVDRKVAALASRQQAAVAHDQLLAAGLSDGAIENWVRRGRLYPRHRGIYILGHEALPKYSEEMAAVLACRPKALISHHAAACMWGFQSKLDRNAIDVTVVGRQARPRAGIRVHRAASLMKADLRFIERVPVVSAARALLEIAGELGAAELELALHEALALKLVTIPQLRRVLKRYQARRGSALLTALVDPTQSQLAADSAASKRLARHLKRSGLPNALVDHPIGRWRADFYWPEVGLVVEVDGFDYHSSRLHIERDHRKDADLRMRGNDVLRFTARQVHRELEFVLVSIARVYERQRLAQHREAA